MKKQNKGFTLVELLIVIVIIGILAAIIIPSVSSAIDKANFASDQSDAKNMNTTLLAYCTTNGIDPSELEAPEVRSIVSSQDKNYTFVPKSSNGVFWYNTAKGEIEVTQTGMPTATSKIGNAVYADGTIDSIEEIVDGYLYLNTQGELANWLRSLRNLMTAPDYDNLVGTNFTAGEFAAYSQRLGAIVAQYSPTDTLFINTIGSYTGDTTVAKKYVVFGSDIRVVTDMTHPVRLESNVVIRIPTTVEIVLPGGFDQIYSENKIETIGKTKFMSGALSDMLARANPSIKNTYSDEEEKALADKLKVANELVSITAGGTPYTSENTAVYSFNKENYCSIFDFSKIAAVNDSDFTINTKEFLAQYPNITVLSVQQYLKNEGDGKIFKQYHVQAFDSTGMVLNVVIIVSPAPAK